MRFVLLFILLNSSFILFARQQETPLQIKDVTFSEYKDGRYFHTYCTCVVKAPFCFTEEIMDEVFDGMKTAPTVKLDWAFSGLGDVGAQEDMLMYETGVVYNPENSEYLLNLLVIVKNDRELPVEIVGELQNINHNSGEKELKLDLTKKIKVLHEGIITVTAIPHTNDTSVIVLNSQLKFGWFFNLFFTQNRYKNIMEWRFSGFLKNIKDRIEAKSQKDNSYLNSEN